ncbi:Zinc finger protein ZPR1 [Frankliniella fusca]|uniref:Zinc finger protein ZPR1 n=1 Tax=Frankliniella fusca TaxID=407009 RepID=A0AAE1LBB7_9NEOP|nr:Zinc finger protein ZPR1 [Frankliniella fusca]
MGETGKKPLFRDINADDPDPEATEIESLCLNCGKNGITRLLLTKIPFYKEVVIMSFSCEHCGFCNNEIQQGGQIQEKGVRITLKVMSASDLNRQVVKSDSTSVSVPEVQLEIPAFSQKGEVTTIEGILDRSVQGLEQDQDTRRKEHPEAAQQIDEFLGKLKKLKELESPFSMVFEDISGNTFIQNPNAPQIDPGVTISHFNRSKEQNHSLGLYSESEVSGGEKSDSNKDGILQPLKEGEFTLETLQGEVLQFPTNCPRCRAPCTTNMKVTNIPYFKEVVIMATNCDTCGERTNEVKSGGGIQPRGMKIEVKVSSKEDFSRDVLKSDTCSLTVPELDVEVGPAALGGRFSTVEGILAAMKDQLLDSDVMFSDSADPANKQKLDDFHKKFQDILQGKDPVTLVLDDPAGNSYVQSLTAPDPDPALSVTHYDRTFEQNEELGLNDMVVENYETEQP